MSGFNWEQDEGDFRDIPDETSVEFHENPTAYRSQTPQPRPSQRAEVQAAYAKYEEEQAMSQAKYGDDYDNDLQLSDDSEEDYSAVLNNANLRLEQGKLYQLIMNHDLFKDTDYDPQAVANVQREIKRFARERMEIMLGMRGDATKNAPFVSSPFNDLEVTVLKMVAARASQGATQSPDANETAEKIAPVARREGLASIGSPKPKAPIPAKQQKPLPSRPQAPVPRPEPALTNALLENYKPIGKQIHEMTPAELAEHNRQASLRQSNKRMVIPPDNQRAPMPSADQMSRVYEMQIGQTDPAGTVSTILALMNQSKKMPG